MFAEGQTEQTFAGTVLKEHLARFNVFVQGPVLVAHARRKGKVHRGGARHYLPMRNDIQRFLAQEKAADTFFTTMIDLYGLPGDFPGLADCEKLRNDPRQRAEKIEESFGNDLGDRRFIPHLQLHEFETLLFVKPPAFGAFYDDCSTQVAALQEIADGHASPEEIDDGPQSAPSKRIVAIFPDYAGAKPTAGPLIAAHIGLPAMREKCPHFAAWLDRLEGLAAPSGPQP